MAATSWDKYYEKNRRGEEVLVPFVEVRRGTRKTSFRVNYRQDGVKLRKRIRVTDPKEVAKEAERIIYNAKFGEKATPKSQVRCETLADEIVKLRESKADATYEQIEIFCRLHIKPFLNEHCPYAANLSNAVWLNYKNHLRLKNPHVSLFNHWKFFGMLCRYARQKGILKEIVKLDFDEEKEDFREEGLVISDTDFQKIIAAATSSRAWRDRLILQRLTGQRPGVIRKLRKDQVNLQSGRVIVEKADSKNRRKYDFLMPAPAIEILRQRIELERAKILLGKKKEESPYFFPMETDQSRPMDKHLGGLRSILKKAKVSEAYTPHDIRHTFLTHKFKESKNPALVCYQCDLSLEEAMETYIHFDAEDTRVIAEESAAWATAVLGAYPKVKEATNPKG